MPNGCPKDAPVELSDGRILYPEDSLTLKDVCEIVPLIIETLMKEAAGPGGPTKITPGSVVPVRPTSPLGGFGQALPGFGARPGSIVPAGPFGAQGTPAGGGGGFGGGGGGRGAQGPAGPAGATGAQGPPGPGTIESPVTKTDGDFTVASTSPFVPIPGTLKTFTQETDGSAVVFIQAVFGSAASSETNGQIGLRVDGTDFPLTANLIHTFVGGVAQFLAGVHASIPLTLSKGSHTVEVVVRGDSALYAPVGLPVTVQANSLIPLHMSIIHE